MKTPVITFISLGSNEGDRLGFLQKAIAAIFEQIGRIDAVSPVYETPAWGFDGNPFLNACIKVETYCPADILLKNLLEIETENGRHRHGNGYENRPLDLDILFYGDETIQTESLVLPHPQLHKRRFVLQPLADIAPDFVPSHFGKSIAELLNETNDDAPIKKIREELNCPKTDFRPVSFLAIEGNIGAGKTSLAQMIAHDFNAKLITERYKDNPFLPKFYENRDRYAFPLEMSFLADRCQQMLDDIAQYDLFNDFVVSDYDIYKSMIFAQVTLADEEYQLYKKLFGIMYRELAKPDLYIYLYQNTERLMENIKIRGRSYEQEIPVDYLNKINCGYLDFIKTQHHFKTKIIDISGMDFIANRKDYLSLLDAINQTGTESSKSPQVPL